MPAATQPPSRRCREQTARSRCKIRSPETVSACALIRDGLSRDGRGIGGSSASTATERTPSILLATWLASSSHGGTSPARCTCTAPWTHHDLDRRVAELGMRVTGGAHLGGDRRVAHLAAIVRRRPRASIRSAQCGEARGADFQRRAVAIEHDVVGGGVVDIDAHQGLDARAHLAVVVAHAPLRRPPVRDFPFRPPTWLDRPMARRRGP